MSTALVFGIICACFIKISTMILNIQHTTPIYLAQMRGLSTIVHFKRKADGIHLKQGHLRDRDPWILFQELHQVFSFEHFLNSLIVEGVQHWNLLDRCLYIPSTSTEASNAIKDESSRNFLPGPISLPPTPAQLALWRISESLNEADKNRIYGRNPGAGSSMATEICGWIQLLRTACGDGEKAGRLRERLRRWLGRGEMVDDEVVKSLDRVMDWEKTS